MKETIIEVFNKLGFTIKITRIIENEQSYQAFFTCNTPIQLSKSQIEFIEREVKSPGRINVNTFVPESNELSIQIPKKSTGKETNNPETTVKIGKTIEDEVISLDFSKFPHLLIGGATGTGKTNLIKLIINELLKTECQITLIDFKLIDFINYKDKINMITDNDTAILEIKRFYNEMKRHQEYILNGFSPSKHYFLIIDEFAELKLDKEGYQELRSILQMGRAFNFHVIISTQRPSASILKGDLKANIDARISLKVSSKIDSRIILDMGGAENLSFKGDMLIKTGIRLVRAQAFKADDPTPIKKEIKEQTLKEEDIELELDQTVLLIPKKLYLNFLKELKTLLKTNIYEFYLPIISEHQIEIIKNFIRENRYNLSEKDMITLDIVLMNNFDEVRQKIIKKRMMKLIETGNFWSAVEKEIELVSRFKPTIIL